jgi:hypothetical protein
MMAAEAEGRETGDSAELNDEIRGCWHETQKGDFLVAGRLKQSFLETGRWTRLIDLGAHGCRLVLQGEES